jgi:hypothetical protein
MDVFDPQTYDRASDLVRYETMTAEELKDEYQNVLVDSQKASKALKATSRGEERERIRGYKHACLNRAERNKISMPCLRNRSQRRLRLQGRGVKSQTAGMGIGVLEPF